MQLHVFVSSTHHTHRTIGLLSPQALLHDTQGNKRVALALLRQALALAELDSFIRSFADLGIYSKTLAASGKNAAYRKFSDKHGTLCVRPSVTTSPARRSA